MAKSATNKKNKTSEYKKDRDGYWIKSRYLLYRFWYKFLQYAEQDPSRKVDWSKYPGWGGPAVILNERFETWWGKRWKRLFGVRNKNSKARFEISNKKARAGAIKVALVVYEHRHLGNLAIFNTLNSKYKNLASLDRYETDSEGNVIFDANGKPRERLIETKYLNQHVKRYLRHSESLLDQVCKGQFGKSL